MEKKEETNQGMAHCTLESSRILFWKGTELYHQEGNKRRFPHK
jgi:hypothetical protein